MGNPVYVELSAGNIHDVAIAEDILSNVSIKDSIVMADKAYGSRAVRESIEQSGGSYCIPPKSNNKEPWECDWWQYKERHLVECFFQKMKQFRRVATRYAVVKSLSGVCSPCLHLYPAEIIYRIQT